MWSQSALPAKVQKEHGEAGRGANYKQSYASWQTALVWGFHLQYLQIFYHINISQLMPYRNNFIEQ